MIKEKNKKPLINDDFAISEFQIAYEFKHYYDNWSHNRGLNNIYTLPLILGGEATFYFNEKPYKVKRGDVAFIEPGYYYRSEGNIDYHSIDIAFHCADDSPLKSTKRVVHVKDVQYYKKLYSEIITLYETPNPFNNIKILSLVYNLIWEIATEYSADKPIHPKFKIIEHSVEYMNSNIFNSNLSIEGIAEKSGISIKYFRNIFKEIYETTPVQYINQQRLKRAEELLRYSNYSIDIIAENCGFNSSIYFTRMFKGKYGVPPGNYRKN